MIRDSTELVVALKLLNEGGEAEEEEGDASWFDKDVAQREDRLVK